MALPKKRMFRFRSKLFFSSCQPLAHGSIAITGFGSYKKSLCKPGPQQGQWLPSRDGQISGHVLRFT